MKGLSIEGQAWKHVLVRRFVVLAVLSVLFAAARARADILKITLTNVTYSATCVGGIGTCTEVINGSFSGNTATGSISSLSLQLTGTYNATLDALGSVAACTSVPGSTTPPYFYDTGAVSGDCPIQFNPTINITASGPARVRRRSAELRRNRGLPIGKFPPADIGNEHNRGFGS